MPELIIEKAFTVGYCSDCDSEDNQLCRVFNTVLGFDGYGVQRCQQCLDAEVPEPE